MTLRLPYGLVTLFVCYIKDLGMSGVADMDAAAREIESFFNKPILHGHFSLSPSQVCHIAFYFDTNPQSVVSSPPIILHLFKYSSTCHSFSFAISLPLHSSHSPGYFPPVTFQLVLFHRDRRLLTIKQPTSYSPLSITFASHIPSVTVL